MPPITILNRYRLDESLGQGGMGVVYRGHDILLKRPVAVKVLSNSDLGTAGKARLLSEAQSAARLNHPNIVTVFDAGESSGFADPGDSLPFIVMELVPGETLRQHKPQDLAEVVEWMRQVCAALEHAHAAGVIHRDLKLENVLLTPGGTVKLMDFGLARSGDGPRLTEEGALMGTFLYMAPELLMGEPATIQSDLYALGVMLYELACGQPPFKGNDPLALISQHLHATPVPPSTYNPAIPAGIETLVLRLLSKQPGDRPISATEVRQSLELSTALDAEPIPTGMPLDRVVRGLLVGRERELAEAIQMFRQAQDGEGNVLLISGEPGVGKSRLARELSVQVQMAHGMSLVGECYADGGVPYAPFAQMILNITDWPIDLAPLVLADLINLAPGLRVRFPAVPPNPPLDPRIEQQRLYESAYTFFANLARRAPLLLVLEDMHWADGGSLALARSLAQRFRQTHTPVLIVLTFREVELTEHQGLVGLLNDWNRERQATPLKLRRLDRQGTQDMLTALFAEAVSVDFTGSIYHETEGNPFFIEEMCKALIESGQVYRENGGWQRRSTTSIEMPRSIRLAIEARLSGLTSTSQEVLHLAAVLGRRFEFDALMTAAEQDEEVLIAALEEAERAQLLNEVGRGGGVTFEFAHALIPATLLETLSGMRRRRLHRQALAALEQLHPEDSKALAHHCLESGEYERALTFLLGAAQRARVAFANVEAVANYQQALGLLNDLLREQAGSASLRDTRLQMLEDLGDVLELTGQHDEAWAAYQDALAIAPPNDTIRQARLYRRAGKTREVLRLYPDAEQAYQQAEVTLGEEPAEAAVEWWQEWIMLQLDRILLGYWMGRVQEMIALAEKVRPTIERYGSPQQRALFHWNRANIGLRRDRYVISDDTMDEAKRALFAAREAGDSSVLNQAEFQLGFVLLWRGELDNAEEQLRSALRLTETSGDVTFQTRSLTYLTLVYRKRGDVENVLKYAARSLEMAAIGQMVEYTSVAQANQAWAARRQGRLQEARELGMSAWQMLQKVAQSTLCWVAVWVMLGLSLVQGQTAEAVDYARELLSPAAQPQPEALAALLQAAIQSWEQGQPERAAAALDQASALAEPLGYL